MLNGVPARRARLFDRTDVFPEYERDLLASVRERVSDGDHVCIVGGGYGVSGVVAANQGASVEIFEPSKEQVEILRDTLTLNRISAGVSVKQASVGPVKNSFGPTTGADRVAPDDLQDMDVLVMDCEGAELEILRNLSVRPETIIVETHALYDAPESEVRAELERLDYTVVDRGVEYHDGGIYILTAIRRD